MSDDAANFEGFKGRRCGDHRTVGTYRAWCHDCDEWCYPGSACPGCFPVTMTNESDLAEKLHDLASFMSAIFDALDGYRAECERRGYSSAVIDSLTMDYHRLLLSGGKK